ncbi:MAG: helix-turn-helix domain-containing protein [Rikenellaceae bacterium]|nr:helix-turn-helix domain-containing protein [Rikenellaceae bacterium]MCL2692697.1 helix-turn-helix domain-containing protein [Rikenellaceae bacterium]
MTRKSDVKPDETRRAALEMHLEGMGFRTIGRILKVSYGTVYRWVDGWSEGLRLPRRPGKATVIELDEMQKYIGRKKTADEHRLLLIDMENGSSLLSIKQSGGEKS